MARFSQVPYVKDFETVVFAEPGSMEYGAFPAVCEAPNGDLVVVYMRATNHVAARDGNIVGKISDDNGATWGTEFTVADNANDLRDPGLLTLANGDIVCTYTEYAGSAETSWCKISDDNGATWGTAISIPSTWDARTFVCGRPIQLPNGDVLAPYYGRDSAETLDNAGVARSQDNGATWAFLTTITDGDEWGRLAQEPCLAYDEDLDRIWCALRSDTGTDTLYLTYSDDDGATWDDPPAALFTGSGKPDLHITPEGCMCIVYRDVLDGNKCKLRYSWDKGTSWSSAQPVNSSNVYKYASWHTLAAGELGLVWAVEISSTDSRVVYQEFEIPVPLVAANTRYPVAVGGAASGVGQAPRL